MIVLDELKPVLEEILTGRDDIADVIDRVASLDKAEDESKLESAIADAVAENDKKWNERYMQTFFGKHADNMDYEVPREEVKVEVKEEIPEDTEYKYEDLWVEDKEDK